MRQKTAAFMSTDQKATRPISVDDFNILKMLGRGNFGKVMLVEHKVTGVLYAMKTLKKEFIIQNDELPSLRSEKLTFMVTSSQPSPFLLKLYGAFQTETRLYFIMEYVAGGDLMNHIQRSPFNYERARFYAIEVLLALEHLHSRDLIYRDLKLDNILLGLDGHIRIADYGLCKALEGVHGLTNTFCGTPEFMAPEVRTRRFRLLPVSLIGSCRSCETRTMAPPSTGGPMACFSTKCSLPSRPLRETTKRTSLTRSSRTRSPIRPSCRPT